MNGKKFMIYFVTGTALIGALGAYWIKSSYDSRPKVQIIEEKK